MKFVDYYHKFLEKYKIAIIVFWAIALGFSVWLGPQLLSETNLVFEAPEDSPAAIANGILDQEFPERSNETSIIILIKSLEEETDILESEDIRIFILALVDSLETYENYENIQSVQDFFTLNSSGMEIIASGLVSQNRKTTLVLITIQGQTKEETATFVYFLEQQIEEYGDNLEEKFFVGITGSRPLLMDVEEGTKGDLARMDSIVIPIAFVILALVLRSLRLMIIPILTMGISFLFSFMVMLPIALSSIDVGTFAPSVMMSLVIAMSIDYSLFLLSRYREEILKGKNNSQAVRLMSEHAGHTILVSGLTLSICFAGMIFFPMDLLATIGMGSAIAVLCTLLINLTLTPAILLTFGRFFSKSKFSLRFKKKKKEEETSKIEETAEQKELNKQLKSTWYKIAKLSTKHAVPIILVVLIIAIPVSIQVFDLKSTVDTNQVFPRGGDYVITYNTLSEEFNPGTILPYYIIISTGETNGIVNQSFFDTCQFMMDELYTNLSLPYNSFFSIFKAPDGTSIPYILGIQYLNNISALYDTPEGILYRLAFERYANQENSTVLIEIQTPFDPYGLEAEEFVKDMRIFLENFSEKETSQYGFYLGGGITFIVDTIDKVYDLFPIMIIITIVVVYILIAVMFKSAFLPLRLLITIALTLSWIYGFAVLVFEKGIFNWLFPVLTDVQALYWITPIMAFSILVGLGLDYDIFLLSRISEYRKMGYTEKASIHKGVYRTGSIITAAGIIMTIAFSGLLLSTEMILNQFGFMLCFAVLVDTFVVRTILVPSIMSLAERWNWWPSKLPEPEKDDFVIE